MVDLQPMEEEFQRAITRDTGTKTHEVPTEPVLQMKKTPSHSPAFNKENIDVLRTMINEHDQQAKMKATPRKLAYIDFDKKAPTRSLARGFSDRFSLKSFGTSDTCKQTRSASKSQRTPSKNRESTHLRRSRRLEDRSITKEKTRRERPNPKGKTSRHQETSLDSECEEDSKRDFGHGNVSFPKPPPLIETPEKQNMNKFYDYQEDRGHNTNDYYQLKKKIEEVVASKKLANLVKDIRRANQRNARQGRNSAKAINMIREGGNYKRSFKERRFSLINELTFPAVPQNQLTDEPIILEGIIKDNQVRRILIDGGSKETIEKGSGVGIIPVNPEEKMYSYAIRLKFNASSHAMDCEALLTGIAVFVSKEVLTGLATIKLEFLNQEVSVGIKTRPSVEETSSSKKGKTTSNVPSAKLNYSREASGSN
nr:reverse transcriptase domain-containing protein [Tanacetum cinerariifolium]